VFDVIERDRRSTTTTGTTMRQKINPSSHPSIHPSLQSRARAPRSSLDGAVAVDRFASKEGRPIERSVGRDVRDVENIPVCMAF